MNKTNFLEALNGEGRQAGSGRELTFGRKKRPGESFLFLWLSP